MSHIVRRGLDWVEVTWPTRVASLANERMHWRKLQNAKNAIKHEMALLVLPHIDANAIGGAASVAAVLRSTGISYRRPICAVTFTRIATRALDSDNLQSAFKYHRDAVANHVGVDDGKPFWVWDYGQAKGEFAARVLVSLGQRMGAYE